MIAVASQWTATVRRATGATAHYQAGSDGVSVLPVPKALRIIQEAAGFFLLRLDENGVCIADTWHSTLDEAKAQARFEYDVGSDDWTQQMQ